MTAPPVRIALLGAESTGKSTLAQDMAARLRGRGHRVAVVEEVLRQWCVRESRTPQAHEQMAIAQEQERRVDAALAGHDIVIADTTSLMVAIYSAMLFADEGLLPDALERQRSYALSLVTGLDLPWVADSLQRDGPHVREPVDRRVREALAQAAVPWQVVYGRGDERARNALDALATALPWAWDASAAPAVRWQGVCERCGNAQCEHRLFTKFTAPKT